MISHSMSKVSPTSNCLIYALHVTIFFHAFLLLNKFVINGILIKGMKKIKKHYNSRIQFL